MPYYDNPGMLLQHFEIWMEYPPEIRKRVRVVVVDDGSPNYPALDVLDKSVPPVPVSLYRIKKDIPWNHGGARNLSVYGVQGDRNWVLTTDMDLVLFPDDVVKLFSREIDPGKVYRLQRLVKTSPTSSWEAYKPHSETYFMTRGMFWTIGGFDERFTGFFNGPFIPFRRQVARVTRVKLLKGVFLRSYHNLVEDATTKGLPRGGSKYDITTNKKALTAREGPLPKKPLVMQYEWEKLV